MLCPSDGLFLRQCCSVPKPPRGASAGSARTIHASENQRSSDKSHSPASLLPAKLSNLERMMTWTPPETTLASAGPLYQGYLNMSCVILAGLESGIEADDQGPTGTPPKQSPVPRHAASPTPWPGRGLRWRSAPGHRRAAGW